MSEYSLKSCAECPINDIEIGQAFCRSIAAEMISLGNNDLLKEFNLFHLTFVQRERMRICALRNTLSGCGRVSVSGVAEETEHDAEIIELSSRYMPEDN